MGTFPVSEGELRRETVCGEDRHAVGGGVRLTPFTRLIEDYPGDGSATGQYGSRGWFARVQSSSNSTAPFAVFAICAPASSVVFRSYQGQYSG